MIQSPQELEAAYQTIQEIGENPSNPEKAARRKELLAEIKEYEENHKRADEAARPDRPIE
jgi:hypothetical protein